MYQKNIESIVVLLRSGEIITVYIFLGAKLLAAHPAMLISHRDNFITIPKRRFGKTIGGNVKCVWTRKVPSNGKPAGSAIDDRYSFFLT